MDAAVGVVDTVQAAQLLMRRKGDLGRCVLVNLIVVVVIIVVFVLSISVSLFVIALIIVAVGFVTVAAVILLSIDVFLAVLNFHLPATPTLGCIGCLQPL